MPLLYTIGFGQKKAEVFFRTIQKQKIKKVIDVRLNNVSQLAGFTKKDDLCYFLREICDCQYEHKIAWAPSKDLLDRFKKGTIEWAQYEEEFLHIIQKRKLMDSVELENIENCCLLCSEPTPEQCHRRLLAEQIKIKYPVISIVHL